MYYVPDGTTKCGFYECKGCRSRVRSLQTMKKYPCGCWEVGAGMACGPDEGMGELTDTAELQEIVEGENVEKMDRLLSLAITGGDYEWL